MDDGRPRNNGNRGTGGEASVPTCWPPPVGSIFLAQSLSLRGRRSEIRTLLTSSQLPACVSRDRHVQEYRVYGNAVVSARCRSSRLSWRARVRCPSRQKTTEDRTVR
jgi:hypothetical protein